PGALVEHDTPGTGSRVGTGVPCDAVELLAAVAAADARRVRELYEGEFLAGFYLKEMGAELEEWVLATREHLASSVQLARVAQAEAVAAERAFGEAGHLAAEALALSKESDPDLLPRLHRLLLAANHPLAGAVERQAAAFGLELADSAEAARAALSSALKRPARNNLPARVAPFVGRDTELVTLANLLASGSRLVTVTGVGGVGKSRLALEAATSALRDGLFDAGVFLVELAPVSDPRLVLEAVAAAVSGEGGSADATGLHETLGDKRVLLLLDNFEHVAEAATDVSTLLEKCPGVAALITSRQRLELSGEQIFQLETMALATATSSAAEALTHDAVRLFQAAARRNDLTFAVADANWHDVLEVCGLVHGLPLGIELAAAWVGRLPLEELAEALRQQPDELLSGPRDAAPRHRSLTATIDHSWRLLLEHERLALTKLAVFSGGFTHDAAARVAEASIAALSSLTAKSLLTGSADGRYTAHPLVGDFAMARLETAEPLRDATLAAHAAYYVDLARHAEEGLKTGDQAGWLNRLDAELPNLREAIGWLSARAREGSLEAARSALEISGSLWQFWPRRGRLAEGRRLADAVLTAAPDDMFASERAKALTGAGVLASQQGDEAASEAFNRTALELRRQTGDRLGQARSLYNLAAAAGQAGDLDTAEARLTEAIDIFRDEDDEWSV
ncbi:MAG TPA: tetratricopeptide repeat protein, partial [Trueperaceae bacterium]|nr:tetratricopeptide repeat protein [Trueperaceae bacterium]